MNLKEQNRRLSTRLAIVAIGITVGKIAVSLLSAFALSYFRFRWRMTAFWLIFASLMLPVEVRIVPTYEAVANAALPLQWLVDALDVGGWPALFGGQRIEIGPWALTIIGKPRVAAPVAAAAPRRNLRREALMLSLLLCERRWNAASRRF